VLADPGRARRASGRGLVLLPAGAFVVHQLRYWLAYGPQANTQLADQGHAYLGSLVPWLVLATAAALGGRLVRVAVLRRDASRVRSLAAVWATCAVALVAIYGAQESLEGVLVQGHPGGLGGVFGHGGWWALPASAGVALAIALLVRVGAALERFAARPKLAFAASPLRARRPCTPQPVSLRPLATAAAGRAPPR
jgi:hypothetical protein